MKKTLSFSHAAAETSSSYLNKIPEISSCLRAAGGGAGGREICCIPPPPSFEYLFSFLEFF